MASKPDPTVPPAASAPVAQPSGCAAATLLPWQAQAAAAIAHAQSVLAWPGAQLAARATDNTLQPADTLAKYKLPVAQVGTLFPDDGNKKYSDCTMVAASHCITIFHAMIGQRVVEPQADVIKEYLAMTGGRNIVLFLRDVLAHWENVGIANERLCAYNEIDHTNHATVRQAIDRFGAVYLRFYVPADKTQMACTSTWEAAPISADGHAVVAVGCDAGGVTMLTFGRMQRADWLWWDLSVAEAYVLLPLQSHIPAFAPGVNGATLEAQFKALAMAPAAATKLAAD